MPRRLHRNTYSDVSGMVTPIGRNLHSIVLHKNSIYELEAVWSKAKYKERGFHGTITYQFVTADYWHLTRYTAGFQKKMKAPIWSITPSRALSRYACTGLQSSFAIGGIFNANGYYVRLLYYEMMDQIWSLKRKKWNLYNGKTANWLFESVRGHYFSVCDYSYSTDFAKT